MEQLPTEKKEKVQGESSSSSENESILPKFADKLNVGESPPELGSDTDLEVALPAILENEAEFDGSDLIAIPNDMKDLPLEALIRAKKYSKITDEQRRDFIDAVEVNGEKIINAAKRFNINYSSAKSILNVYKNEGRSIKKLTRNRGAKETEEANQDSKVGTEVKPPSNSQNNGEQQKIMVTFDAATQTQPQEESQGDNYLLALRDRLIASKTDKRENPYTNSMSHDFTRHAGNLGDYTQLQMTGNGYDNTFNIQMEGSRSQAPETKQQVQFVSTSPYSGVGQGGSPGQYVSTGNSQSQSYQQQQGSQQISFNPENRGIYSSNQQPSGSNNLSNQQQPQTYMSQQDHKNQAQQYLTAQNNLDQQRLQSAAGSQNQLVNLGFSQPGANNDFSGMSYTGTGQSQYFSDSANDSRNMMQMGQVQYLQPIMYLMPSNFSGMSGMSGMTGMTGQNGFVPSGLQGLQSLQGLQNLGNLGNLGNLVSLPNSFMLYNGQGQQNQAGQSNQGQGQGGQSQSQSQSNQSQGQSQNQGSNQQSQPQYQSQTYYQNQGQYFGSR